MFDVLPLYFSLFDASFFSKITAIARLPDAFRGSPSINWFSLLRRTKSSSCIQKIGIGVLDMHHVLCHRIYHGWRLSDLLE